ncbi:STAS domain-containing protein [Crossiella sp. NPDC003009]
MSSATPQDHTPTAAAAAPMTVTVVSHPEGVVLTLVGEVDMLTTPDLRKTLKEVLATEPPAIVLDLTEVDFFGSSGLAALAETHQQAGRTDLRVVTTSAAVLRPLHVTALDRLIGVFPTVTAALEASV